MRDYLLWANMVCDQVQNLTRKLKKKKALDKHRSVEGNRIIFYKGCVNKPVDFQSLSHRFCPCLNCHRSGVLAPLSAASSCTLWEQLSK